MKKAQTETFDSFKSELSGVFWRWGYIKSARLSEIPTYPGYDITGLTV